MSRIPNSVVGDAVTSTESWDTLEALVSVGNRMAGQAGEAEGAEIIADAFERGGAREVEINEFEIPGWWRGSSSLSVGGETLAADHEVIALPGTPSGEATGELVDVGYGLAENFEERDLDGKIVMASSETPEGHGRWIHRMEKYVCAANAGAVGFVFRNHVEGCLPPTGEIGYHNRPGPIPAVGVSKEVGTRLLREHAAEGNEGEEDSGSETTISVECRNEPTNSRNVEAVVGPDTEKEVLVTAHVDAHDISEGANDNGAGSALVAEIGRLLEQVELACRVRLITFGSEEIGLYGAYHAAETHDLESIKCVINIDGAGNSRNLGVGTNGFTELGDAFEEVTDEMRLPLSMHERISPHGDQWAFVQEGVPSVMAYSRSEGSGRGWGHTHADTLDKLDIRDLRAIALALSNVVVAVAEEDREIPHKSREQIRDEIDEGYVEELKLGGRWPYDE
ncbi:Zn-dependent amino-or carboxypeptidase, M28 family [Haladaptatus litoreus]|uniref:Carboxypeptidase Q n=1 Tax=Haladaptatus litoreus TaxID=553468 RepID=A0A1N7E5U2_9EURY|nr:M28 family peptidase [Haladaptatus litoreus]SIR83375.1 Zn-dependent amino-or carboxypeptidase, M28 family [Haladaptatus litoreus]